MFDRLIAVFKGLFNKGMKELETPEVLAEQAQMELESSHKKIKEAVITAITAEKALEKQIEANSKKIEEWVRRAQISVQQKNDELAKECLQKKQEHTQQDDQLKTQLEEQKKATSALKSRLSEIEQQLRDFHVKKKDMTARLKAGDALSKANEILDSSPGGTGAMAKLEDKIREKEARNEALAEMRGTPLEDKFKGLEGASELDMELAALKEQMAEQPKLIGADKNVKLIQMDQKEVKAIEATVEDVTDVEVEKD